MHGPRYARTGPLPIARSCSTAASMTPCSRPRCPACTTPTASSQASATGAQSAVSTATGSPGVAVTAASASGGSAPVGSDATCTAVPCTWRIHTQPAGSPSPASRPTRARFATTSSGRSPTWSPTLHESYGAIETPPARPLHHTRAGPNETRVSSTRSVLPPPVSAGTRGRRSRRRPGRARPPRRASPRRRGRGGSRTRGGRSAARLRSGRSRRRSR